MTHKLLQPTSNDLPTFTVQTRRHRNKKRKKKKKQQKNEKNIEKHIEDNPGKKRNNREKTSENTENKPRKHPREHLRKTWKKEAKKKNVEQKPENTKKHTRKPEQTWKNPRTHPKKYRIQHKRRGEKHRREKHGGNNTERKTHGEEHKEKDKRRKTQGENTRAGEKGETKRDTKTGKKERKQRRKQNRKKKRKTKGENKEQKTGENQRKNNGGKTIEKMSEERKRRWEGVTSGKERKMGEKLENGQKGEKTEKQTRVNGENNGKTTGKRQRRKTTTGEKQQREKTQRRKTTGKKQRILCCVDSRAVLGAVTLGRSSSGKLNFCLRQFANGCLASSLTVDLLSVPSWANPADAPSRQTSLAAWRRGLLTWRVQPPEVVHGSLAVARELKLLQEPLPPHAAALLGPCFAPPACPSHGRSNDRWRLQQLLDAGDVEPRPGPPRKRPAPSQYLLQAVVLPRFSWSSSTPSPCVTSQASHDSNLTRSATFCCSSSNLGIPLPCGSVARVPHAEHCITPLAVANSNFFHGQEPRIFDRLSSPQRFKIDRQNQI